MIRILLISGVLFTFFLMADNARILAISHINSYSHFIITDRILQELVKRGHDVTLITPFEEKSVIENYRHVVISGFNDTLNEWKGDLFKLSEISIFQEMYADYVYGPFLAETVLNNTNVQSLLKSNQQFDVVIHEQFLNEAFYGFSHHFKALSIIICPISASRVIYDRMGSANTPSYIRDSSLALPNAMNFLERGYNLIYSVVIQLWHEFATIPKHNELLQKYFPGTPHLKELFYNTSLVLINSHVSVNPPIPLVPNIIDVGGYHLQPPQILPKDLQAYLDEATAGVILFGMGSNLEFKDTSDQIKIDILNVFSQVKQTILMKWEDDLVPHLPSNIKLVKWLPQQDILAHSNVKLFITHGGLLSIIESVYHGVPLFGIPVYGDQPFNLKNAEFEGYGLSVPYQHLTKDTFREVLNELLTNPKYAANAKRASKIMRDQLTPPLERAIYWIEYVIRHKGAHHLRTEALNLKWYQYLLLDVIGFLLLIFITILWMFYRIIKIVLSSIRSPGSDNLNKKKID